MVKEAGVSLGEWGPGKKKVCRGEIRSIVLFAMDVVGERFCRRGIGIVGGDDGELRVKKGGKKRKFRNV